MHQITRRGFALGSVMALAAQPAWTLGRNQYRIMLDPNGAPGRDLRLQNVLLAVDQDPQDALAFLRQSGLDSLSLDLAVPVDLADAIPVAQSFQRKALRSNIYLNIITGDRAALVLRVGPPSRETPLWFLRTWSI